MLSINTFSQALVRDVWRADHALRAASRTAASLVFRGLHPVARSLSMASGIARTPPAHPRPLPAPPVHRYSTADRPISSQTASARERKVTAASLPRLNTETGPSAAPTPAAMPRA